MARARECLSPHDEEMAALVDDYESFCSDRDLLPTDRRTLFVPPCGQSSADNEEFLLYYYPATSYRRKAKYLGVYKDRRVQAIGRILKVVASNVDLDTRTVTVQGTGGLTNEEERRVLGATEKAQGRGWDTSTGHKFYLCDAMEATDFRKETPGGLPGHRYFDLEIVLGSKIPESLNELAARLRDCTW